MDQSNIEPYEIIDTGAEVIGGGQVYDIATIGWQKLYGGRFTPNLQYTTDNYTAPKKDYVNQRWTYESNRVTSKVPVTFTMNVSFPASKKAEFQTLLDMGDTFGLKMIRGGNGLISMMKGATPEGQLYCIIKTINPTESSSKDINVFTAGIQFEIVVA